MSRESTCLETPSFSNARFLSYRRRTPSTHLADVPLPVVSHLLHVLVHVKVLGFRAKVARVTNVNRTFQLQPSTSTPCVFNLNSKHPSRAFKTWPTLEKIADGWCYCIDTVPYRIVFILFYFPRIDIPKYRIFDTSYRACFALLSIPWHPPRFFNADTERKLRCVYY